MERSFTQSTIGLNISDLLSESGLASPSPVVKESPGKVNINKVDYQIELEKLVKKSRGTAYEKTLQRFMETKLAEQFQESVEKHSHLVPYQVDSDVNELLQSRSIIQHDNTKSMNTSSRAFEMPLARRSYKKQSSIAGADSNHLGRQRPGNPSEHLGNIAATEGSKFSSGGKLSVSVTIEDFNQWLEQNQQWKSKSNDKVKTFAIKRETEAKLQSVPKMYKRSEASKTVCLQSAAADLRERHKIHKESLFRPRLCEKSKRMVTERDIASDRVKQSQTNSDYDAFSQSFIRNIEKKPFLQQNKANVTLKKKKSDGKHSTGASNAATGGDESKSTVAPSASAPFIPPRISLLPHTPVRVPAKEYNITTWDCSRGRNKKAAGRGGRARSQSPGNAASSSEERGRVTFRGSCGDTAVLQSTYRSSSEPREISPAFRYAAPESKKIMSRREDNFIDRVLKSVENYYTKKALEVRLDGEEGGGPGQYDIKSHPSYRGYSHIVGNIRTIDGESNTPSKGKKGFSFSTIKRDSNDPIKRRDKREAKAKVVGSLKGDPIAAH